MAGELSPASELVVKQRLMVEVYGLARFLVIHRPACRCTLLRLPSRRHRHLEAATLLDVLTQVWPEDFRSAATAHLEWDAHVRSLITRTALGRCHPYLHIDPTYRPLMKEPPVPEFAVLVAPDATGKQMVHDPDCDHAARKRALAQKTAVTFLVGSLHELVPLALPGFPGPVEETAESEFEIKECIRHLPVKAPTPVSLATKLQVARKRAYSALVALYSTAHTVDAERARGAAQRLEQRVASTSERRRQNANLRVSDVWEHLVTASEAACWLAVRQEAEDFPGWAELDDQGKADRWVKAALGARHRYRRQEEAGLEQGGTTMGRAFKEAELEGVRQFRAQVNNALHEVDELRRKAADAAG